MTALPTEFRRWVAPKAAPSFREAARLTRVKLRPPLADEVLVRTIYATVNAGHDTFVARREGYFKDISGTCNLGCDGLGEIVALGSGVSDLEVGDYVSCVGCSSFSEFTTPKSRACFKVDNPKPEYAALRVAGTFASACLEHVAKIEAGRTLMVTAACGGVGHLAAQFGRLNGCHVIGTCGSPEKKAKLQELKVDRVIDHSEESVAEVLEKEYPSGVDYVMDGVGGELGKIAFQNLAPNGKLLCIGFFSQYPHTGKYELALKEGVTEKAPPMAEVLWKLTDLKIGDKEIIGYTWAKDPAVIEQSRARAFFLFDQGQLKVVIDQHAFHHLSGIENAVAATDYMLTGKNVGKVLIRIAPEI